MDFLLEGHRLLDAAFGFGRSGNPQGVRGFGIGLMWREGDFSQQRGLVLLVDRGLPGFPYSAVRVKLEDEVRDVPCCAYVLDGYPYHPVSARPVAGEPELLLGAPLSRTPGFAEGTWACFLGTPAAVAVTAAHLFGSSSDGSPMYCGTRRVGSLERRLGDVALVRLAPEHAPQVRSMTPGGRNVVGAARLSLNSLGQRGFVFSPTRGLTVSPRILGAEMTLHLVQAAGATLTQHGAIMTEGCTQPGDSGTSLLTPDGYAVGVLSHGRKEFSFFESIPPITL